MVVITIFPQIASKIAILFGFKSTVNVVFLFSVCLVIIITLSLTMIVSILNDKLKKLAQTQALLEKRIRELEDK